MSRKTVLWRKKIGRSWSEKRKGGSTRTLRSGNGGVLTGIIPTGVSRGNGRWLAYHDVTGNPTKEQDVRGAGHICTYPMNAEKEQRIRKLVPK